MVGRTWLRHRGCSWFIGARAVRRKRPRFSASASASPRAFAQAALWRSGAPGGSRELGGLSALGGPRVHHWGLRGFYRAFAVLSAHFVLAFVVSNFFSPTGLCSARKNVREHIRPSHQQSGIKVACRGGISLVSLFCTLLCWLEVRSVHPHPLLEDASCDRPLSSGRLAPN